MTNLPLIMIPLTAKEDICRRCERVHFAKDDRCRRTPFLSIAEYRHRDLASFYWFPNKAELYFKDLDKER